jgi:hypothetical protein
MTHMVDVGRFNRDQVAERGQWIRSFEAKFTLSPTYKNVNKFGESSDLVFLSVADFLCY